MLISLFRRPPATGSNLRLKRFEGVLVPGAERQVQAFAKDSQLCWGPTVFPMPPGTLLLLCP